MFNILERFSKHLTISNAIRERTITLIMLPELPRCLYKIQDKRLKNIFEDSGTNYRGNLNKPRYTVILIMLNNLIFAGCVHRA